MYYVTRKHTLNLKPRNQDQFLQKSKGYLTYLTRLHLLQEPTERMPSGYSSHGVKASLRHIKELEIDRGNEWVKDAWLDLDRSRAIWVCRDRKRAAEYIMNAGDLDRRDPTEREQEAVVKVDLTDSIMLLSDGDEGFLHVWPQRRGTLESKPYILTIGSNIGSKDG